MADGVVIDYAEERRLNSPDQVLVSRQAREKKQLKTDLKASTAFVKRVSTISEETAAQLAKDANGDKLNLTKFVEEIVTSLSKALIKMKDIPAATGFASAMHRLYDSFLDPFLSSLVDQYEVCFKVETKPEVVRRRVLLRWFGELYVCGLLQDSVFLKQLRLATRHGSPAGPFESETIAPLPDQALANLPGMSMLFKHLGNVLLVAKSLDGFPSTRQRISALLTNYVQMCTARLDTEVVAIKRMRAKMDADNLKRGLQPTAEQVELFERREKYVDEIYQFCLFACTQLLSIAPPPEPTYQDDIDEQKFAQEEKGLELWSRKRGEQGGGEQTLDSWVFGDEISRAFYQDLDDLEILVPRMILDRADQALQPEPGLITPTTVDLAAAAAAGDAPEEETLESEVVEQDEEEEEEGGGEQTKQPVESVARPVEDLMARLPNMLSVRAVEAFARDFAHVNSKSARKRLVQELFNVPWGRTELIPFYARLAATLSNMYTGIGKLLTDSVRKAYFRSSRDKRPGSRMNSRVRYAKYLGELVKFGLRFPLLECPPAAAFLALKQTLDSFQGENIDMACVLLETCGRELYRFPRTHPEMARLLEIVQRMKQNKNLTPVQEATVENAYFHCIPPPVSELKKKARRDRSAVEQYVRHLLLNRLGAYEDNNTKDARSVQLQRQSSEVLHALLTLPWNTEYEQCEDAIVRAFLASCKSRAGSVPLVCLAVSQVSKVYPNVAIAALDSLLETIANAMETNDSRMNQRRIGQAKCLGHMLRQNLVKDDLFFDVLFAMLHWGHERAGGGSSLACNMSNAAKYHPAVPCLPSDPPYDGFRVRLVCAAMESAADRIVTPVCFPKLDLFLTYLERYVYCKSYFPLEVEFVLLDTLQELERKYLQVQQKRVLVQMQKVKGAAARAKKQAEEFAKLTPVQLVGRSANLQAAEDAVAKAEGRGLQKSVLSASATIAEEDEEEEDEEEAVVEEEVVQEEAEESEEEESQQQQQQQQPYRKVKEEREPTAEDIAFELEFAKLMKETVEQSGKANLAGTAAARGDNLVVPLGIAKRPSGQPMVQQVAGETTMLRLVKRSAGGRKVEVRDMQVPSTIMLAKASSMSKDLQEREEKEAMKKLTLATTSRMRQEGGFT